MGGLSQERLVEMGPFIPPERQIDLAQVFAPAVRFKWTVER